VTSRAFAFLSVGAAGFAVQTAVLAALTAARWPLTLAASLAVEAAVLTNYGWHERWTFRDRGRERRLERLARFHLATGLTSLVGTTALTVVFARTLKLNPLAANAGAVALLSVVNYLALDRWVYVRRVLIGATLVGGLSQPAAGAELTPAAVADRARTTASSSVSIRTGATGRSAARCRWTSCRYR
jgi:putative flippase GtrA